jgi:trans-2,3-dihydro-3-hydroxyanthranilate isomerase
MRFFILDVFGTERYSGNQLAVFFDFGQLSTNEMQKIAKEVNFSETTFILNEEIHNNGYPVKIFTPESEIEFAGHPTLGTAYIIKKYLDKENSNLINLNLLVGQISVDIENEEYWMTQKQPTFGKELQRNLLAKVLGLEVDEIDNTFPILEVTTGLPFTIVPLKTKESLVKARIDLSEYEAFIQQTWAKGILIFCSEGYDQYQELSTRVFVNYLGIPEDPATGSATGCLAGYLLKTNYYDSSSLDLTVGQGYEIGRPSSLRIKANMSEKGYNIRIGGEVIEIAEGNWK